MGNTVLIVESTLRLTPASTGSRVYGAIFFVLCSGILSLSLAQSHSSPPSVGEVRPISSTAGQSSFGKNSFIEYVAGNLPILISVPHGGYLKPSTIPDRILGTAGHQDTKTEELAREIIEQFRRQTGRVPHVVINRLHRDKLDANRELFDAAQDDPIATEAWNEFHNFIDTAEQRIQQEFGTGLYIDLHGHRHTRQVIELGYLLVSSQLKLADAALDSSVLPGPTSLGVNLNDRTMPLSQLVRGPHSLGAALEREGFATVPSPAHPHPNDKPYFSGGYNLEQHSAFSGRNVWGIQVELPTTIREDDTRRRAFADAFVRSALSFLSNSWE
jgi:hypothetical protein